MADKRKMGARDGRVTKEPTSQPADPGFFKQAMDLFGFGGNTSGIRTATQGLDKVNRFVKKRKQRQLQR